MRILIVEDDALLGEMLREYLQHLDHEKVVVCPTGREAVNFIGYDVFDCVFVDLNLPDMVGVQLLATIKGHDPSLPVVMMSGYPTMEYTIEAMRKGASDFLTKPFTLQDLALTLERVTKERRLLLENLSLQVECQARKQLELVNRQLEERIQEQTKLFQISNEIDEIRSNDDLYKCVVNLSTRLTGAHKVGLFILPPERDKLVLMSSQGMNGYTSQNPVLSLARPQMEDILSYKSGPVLLNAANLLDESQLSQWNLDSDGIACWPLRIRGELFGFLMVFYNGSAKRFSSSEVKLIDFLTKKTSLAIENMALYESLIANFYGILRSLVNALEAKDLYTGKHSERVTRYAVLIAKAIGCHVGHIESLQTAGYLHDLGKMGIADKILNKPGSLTSEEYEVIKQHPVIGELIVADLGLSFDERAIIRHHHERWDGRGYPDGLAGEEIPLLARIITVADVYDAMTSKRAYRDAMSQAAALREIKDNRGKQFDPDIVDAFIQVVENNISR